MRQIKVMRKGPGNCLLPDESGQLIRTEAREETSGETIGEAIEEANEKQGKRQAKKNRCRSGSGFR
ncbi:hypothetical protein G3O06_37680 [Burkholderia sp. Ac-20345]|uniref:hypothetical protein n=1 Tax=Burkholderia sp. Ac-20345 TaxID=2703891 RepID=UPI00197C9947|nr:hypothetical protein [Burkholderia sp. Ac-20345]MBN3783213.1 hypothetical protein [Burkholderia sp. Ac-20345]